MTNDTLEKGKKLKKEIDKTKSEIQILSLCFENKNPIKKIQERLYIGFRRWQMGCDAEPKYEYKALVFFPGRLNGIDMDIDEGLVQTIIKYLEEKKEKLEKEFKELGNDETS